MEPGVRLAPFDLPLPFLKCHSIMGKNLRFALELAPAHPPLAHPIYASGMGNRSAIAGGLAPLDQPRPSWDAAPQGVVWSLTRRLYV